MRSSFHADTCHPMLCSRSGLGTTLAQISSRILLVWYICPFYPQVRQMRQNELARRQADTWLCSKGYGHSVVLLNGLCVVRH